MNVKVDADEKAEPGAAHSRYALDMHPILKIAAAWEAAWWARRRALRASQYNKAVARSQETGKPLLVVGAPDGGVTAGYGCGDVTIDVAGSACPTTISHDITTRMPFEDDSHVIFVSCVLEYVSDADAALKELRRVSGGDLFAVRVEPWTLTAYLYPGAKRTLPRIPELF